MADEATLYLLLGCDADPDRPRYGGPRYDSREPLQWRGLREGIPLARDILNALGASHGVRPLVTWCVRSDLQVAELHGRPAWPYAELEDLWRQLADEGDEIGWHPHLWRWSGEHRCWYQEIKDEEWMHSCLREGFGDLAALLRRPPTSARMGWEFHNNLTMRVMAELGVRVDFSGSPGQQLWPDSNNEGSRFDRRMDWAVTRERPYRPAIADYRRAAGPGEEALDIWEVPTTSYVPPPLRLAARLGAMARRVRRGRLSEALSPRVLRSTLHAPGLAMRPEFVRGAVQRQVAAARREGEALLALVFHADELLEPTGSGKQRFYRSQYFHQNLVTILEAARAAGVRVCPLKAASVPQSLAAVPAQPATADAPRATVP